MPIETYTTKQISFTLDMVKLKEAIEKCYLGLGTPSSPIAADAFLTAPTQPLAEFSMGEMLEIKLVTANINSVIQIVCCKFQNIGNNYINGLTTTSSIIDHWHSIFDFSNDNPNIMLNDDGTLCITSNGNGFTIPVLNDSDKPNLISYLSYSIIFSYEYTEGNINHNYHFRIDPIIKVSSNPPS